MHIFDVLKVAAKDFYKGMRYDTFCGRFCCFFLVLCCICVGQTASNWNKGQTSILYTVYSILNKCLWQVEDVHPVFELRLGWTDISCWGCPPQDAILAKV